MFQSMLPFTLQSSSSVSKVYLHQHHTLSIQSVAEWKCECLLDHRQMAANHKHLMEKLIAPDHPNEQLRSLVPLVL